jgi:hypothetical protein
MCSYPLRLREVGPAGDLALVGDCLANPVS